MTDMELQVTRIFVGLLVSFLGAGIFSVFAGVADTASSLIMAFTISVICTLGLSLFIWIPFFWIVGFIALEIFGLFGRVSANGGHAGAGQGAGDRPVALSVRTDTQAMVSYINQSRVHGASDQQIATRLRSKGWTDGEINHAFQQASEPRNEP